MLAIGGQTPTLKNPPFVGAHPVWDLPTIFTSARARGRALGGFPGPDRYPMKFYDELNTPAAADAQFTRPTTSLPMATAGDAARISSTPGAQTATTSIRLDASRSGLPRQGPGSGVAACRRRREGGRWQDTVFILTWDDWGGYADHVRTPIETVPDALHPSRLSGDRRLAPAADPIRRSGRTDDRHPWHSHASILKTVIDLLELPAFGIPRVDEASSLAGRVSPSLKRPPPPAFGTEVVQPKAPHRHPNRGRRLPGADLSEHRCRRSWPTAANQSPHRRTDS